MAVDSRQRCEYGCNSYTGQCHRPSPDSLCGTVWTGATSARSAPMYGANSLDQLCVSSQATLVNINRPAPDYPF